jgi:hypothetical protein
MPFIGNQPAESYSAFQKQDFSTSATTSYTLDHPVANGNEIALFINFVRQEPTAAYTASGTSLTLTSATTSSDDMYCVYLGKAVQTVNPPSGSVGASQLASDAVTSAKADFFNADTSAADLGAGLHIKTGDSGASVAANYDEIVIENSSHAGMSILTGTSSVGAVRFGDSGDNDIGGVLYDHSNNDLTLKVNAADAAKIDSSANLQFNSGYGSATTAFGVRAWVKFNGTGTISITASGNVSSLSDNGTGDYAITFTTALVDANYAHFANSVKGGGAPTSSNSGIGFGIENRTVNGFGVAVGQLNGTIVDRSEVFGCVIR